MAFHRFFSGLRPTLHIAHRGGAALFPENTLLAFEAAARQFRTDILETDVHCTRDGEIVISHDATVDRCTDGAGAIASMTLSQLRKLDAGFRFSSDGHTFPFRGRGARIPTLTEAIRALPAMRWNIDLKSGDERTVRVFTDVIRGEKATDRICCGSELDAVAASLHARLPEACHFYPRNALTAFVVCAKTDAELAKDERYSVLDMPLEHQGMRLVDAAFVETATRAGKWINVWTIDDALEMKELVALGVGGIMTDRPDRLREVLSVTPAPPAR